jgi:hypothetical protein
MFHWSFAIFGGISRQVLLHQAFVTGDIVVLSSAILDDITCQLDLT